MKKWNDVTSLERSAMARIKGGKNPCMGPVYCQGASQTVRTLLLLQKAGIAEELDPKEEEVAEDNED